VSEVPATADRRPIAARKLGLVQSLAAWLARIGVSANSISVASVVFACAAGGLLAAAPRAEPEYDRAMLVLAAVLIQLRLLANLLDGLVAVEGGRRTPTGELYNEVPDRLSDAAVLIGAGYGLTGSVTLGYLAALLAVMTAYIRAVGKGAGAGSDFGGPMAKQQRMMLITGSALFLATTPRHWWPTIVPWGEPLGLVGMVLAVIALGSALTCVLRLRRIAARMRKGAP
jgi:phosphatidylglycerophosphate synthase